MSIILVFGDGVVLDIVVGVWCDRKGIVNSLWIGRYSNDVVGGEVLNELMRCCWYVVVVVGDYIFMYGGFRGGMCYIVYSIFLILVKEKSVFYEVCSVFIVDEILEKWG